MAIGMDKLAGPVSPGDIIMRNEEAPRGAAALLNKMINKGTRGMYKLPEAEKEMPGFMKDAIKESEQAAVDPSDFRTILRILEAGGNPEDYMEQVKLDASDFRTILKLLQQGFSMEEIENMTQASMTKDGPTKGLTMKDIANLDKAAVQGGTINFLGEQPEVTAPIRAQSHVDSPPTQLAYITDAEKDLLVKANIHGSMDGKPNPGPAGIASLDDFYTYIDEKGDTQIGGGSGQQVFDSGVDIPQGGAGGDPSLAGGYESSEAEGIGPGQAVTNPFDEKGNFVGSTIIDAPAFAGPPSEKFQTGSTDSTTANKALDLLNKEIANLEKDKELSKEEETRLKGLYERRFNILGGKTQQGESQIATDDEEEDKEKKKNDFQKLMQLIMPGSQLLGEALSAPPILDFNKEQQARVDQLLKDYQKKTGGNILDILPRGKGEYYRDDGTLTREGFVKAMRAIDMGDGASALATLKRDQPVDYYDKMGMPATSGELADLGGKAALQKTADGKGYITPDGRTISKEQGDKYNNMIFEARMLTNKKKDDDLSKRGVGTAAPAAVKKPMEEIAKEQSEYAGMFDVPGTMMFEGKEVPVGRRFSTNIEDVMKRALEGTSERQLEPFAQYVKRRRDFLGEDEDEFFDEEGNVIYGGVA